MKNSKILIASILIIILVLFMPTPSISYPFSNIDQECEECHSDFEAFELIIDAPSEVPEDYEFDFKVIVKNQGEHDVQDLMAVIDLSDAPYLELASGVSEPYHQEHSGSVGIGGTETYSFPVEESASDAVIDLDGDEGLFGMNDIDLVVTSPNGREWTSEESSTDEQVILDRQDFIRGGYGEYTVDVIYFMGRPPISFTLTIDVTYEANGSYLPGSDIGPGEEYTFLLPLRSTGKGDNIIDVTVTGTAYHDHGETDATDSHFYTYEESSEVRVGEKFVYSPPDDSEGIRISILLLERITGLLSGFFLIVSTAFSGLFKPVSSRVEKFVGGGSKRTKWHCRVSFVLIILSLFHGILLAFSPHAAVQRGLALGTSAFIVLGLLGFVGWQQKLLTQQWGSKKWRRTHLVLTIIVVIVILVHALADGTDFAWIR
jgi:hypothetical protein